VSVYAAKIRKTPRKRIESKIFPIFVPKSRSWMKKHLLTLFAIILISPLFAQQGDVVLCEGFFNPWLEEGWDAKGDDWVVWYVSNTTFAGCKPHEMQMYPDFNFEGTTRLVTPIVELDKYDFINFQFNHALEATLGEINAQIGIGISTNGEDWESIWEDTLVGSIAQSQYLLTFDMQEWTTKSPQFCLYFKGHGAYVTSWYIDNVIVFASKKNKYGGIDDTDENGFIASASHITTLKGPSAGTITHFSKMRKSRSRYARVVEGRQKKWWQFWK
jgi:hypothetical protein